MSETNDRTLDNARASRGLAMAEHLRIRQEAGTWIVPSASGEGRYKVDFESGTCSCPDHEVRGVRCKHLFAVEYTIERETQPDGTTTVTEAVRVTYSQNWPAYNAAQVEEGERFRILLADLCSLIEQPEQTRGRPRLALADMTFACVLKVFEGFSSRRFMSALREAQACGFVKRTPHYNSLNTYLADPTLTPILSELVRASAMPLAAVETNFAIDATGFGTGRFQRWYTHKYGREVERREWVKLHAMIGVETLAVTAAEVTNGNAADSPKFLPLIWQTPAAFDVQEVSADKGYLSRTNQRTALRMGIEPYIPHKANVRPPVPGSVLYRLYHQFAFERETFLAHYHQRSNVESAFSAIKRKFGDSLRTKTFEGNVNETLGKVIAHNLSVVIRTSHTLGVEATFRAGTPAAQEISHW